MSSAQVAREDFILKIISLVLLFFGNLLGERPKFPDSTEVVKHNKQSKKQRK